MSLTPKLLKDAQIKLNNTHNPVFMPQFGFGTAANADELEINKEAIKVAVRDAGIRCIDTARFYGGGKIEYAVGEAIEELIKEKVVTREELFITTKIWPNQWNKAQESLDKSLKALKLDYVDLLLQHWPICFLEIVNPATGELYGTPHDEKTGKPLYDETGDYITTYKQMDAIYNSPNNTKVRAIGVSNYAVSQLERVLADDTIKTKPSILQVELNPQLNQEELVKFCTKNGIVVIGYSPLGSTGAPILKLPEVNEIAKAHDITAYDVIVSWFIKKNLAVIPRSLNLQRVAKMKYYYDLTDDEVAKIDQIGIDKPYRHIDEDFTAILPGFTGRVKTENK